MTARKTAHKQYARLEGTAIWRPSAQEQRRDVIVSLGKTTLTIATSADQPLAHWSLAAVTRQNPGESPPLFTPGPDADETLEIEDETFAQALEDLLRALARTRPHHGRLRLLVAAGVLAALLGAGIFWLPGALTAYTVRIVPPATRAALGDRLVERLSRIAGAPCRNPLGLGALDSLRARVLGPESPARLAVLTDMVPLSAHLPGHTILLSRRLVEEPNGPEAIAGFVLAEEERIEERDPLLDLLETAGLSATLTLLTTGTLPEAALDRHAEIVLTRPPAPVDHDRLIARFKAAGFSAEPYARMLDPSGQSTAWLIKADPVPLARSRPPLTDGQWISLQQICIE